jgi:hypothetical protein
MSWWSKLERRLEPFAISNLTLYVVIAQAFVYLTAMLALLDPRKLILLPAAVMHGEVWRVFTFVAMPPNTHWVFFAFALYFLYLTGNALEQHLGVLRYNLFLLLAYVLTVATAFVTPLVPATNVYIAGIIFLGFAFLNPTFTIYLFMILPVQVRWLALFVWVSYGYAFVVGGLPTRLAIGASLASFLLFFGSSIRQRLQTGALQQRQQVQRAKLRVEEGPRHRCFVCGKNSDTHPDLDFRYCSKCVGDQCYCPEHIRNHEHVLTETETPVRKE